MTERLPTGHLRLAEEYESLLDTFRFDTLEYFFLMAKRLSFMEIAA